MQSEVQLTPPAPKPTCHPWYSGSPCDIAWQNYNNSVQQRQQEELQLYVNRQKALATEQATAPLQQQIADQQDQFQRVQAQMQQELSEQQAQIKKLNGQIQSQMIEASQSKIASHNEGLLQGAGIGLGAALILFGVIFGVRRLTRKFTITKKEQARAASA
jgi:hypothetical protein